MDNKDLDPLTRFWEYDNHGRKVYKDDWQMDYKENLKPTEAASIIKKYEKARKHVMMVEHARYVYSHYFLKIFRRMR